MDLTYFNPSLQDEASFRANFIARQEILAYFLNQLRRTEPGQPARHHLIVAPRGYGKTSLLRRIALGIRDEADLNARFIALRFREEQHNVISLDLFWRNCLESLLESREEEHAPAPEIRELEDAWERHAPRQELPREQQDGLPAWEELKTRCERLGRRAVLLMDNFDTLLAGLSDLHQWSLRRILQSEDGPVLLAAAPRYPDSAHDANAAFYDFFRVQTLDKLENDEVLRCLRAIALHRKDAGKPVLSLLDSDPGRVAALNTMAGGNPRTLNVLYGVLESHMSADVFSQLSAMLDTFTGWYQARTEEMPMQARAVFDALALNWDPMTAAAVGAATGLDTPSVNSQLSRLERSGFVETVQLSRRGKGRNGYQVSERFFNIWYLMRNGPRRARHSVRFLTVFLQSCFNANERRQLARNLLAAQATEMELPLALASHERNRTLREQLLDHARYCAGQSGRLEDFQEIVQNLPKIDLGKGSAKTRSVKAAADLHSKALKFFESGELMQAMEILDSVVTNFGETEELALREPVAIALLNKGVVLAGLGCLEPAIEAWNSVVARFGDAGEPVLHGLVVRALVNKGSALAEMGRLESAIEAYGSVVARFGDAEEPALREEVAKALVNKGYDLAKLGRLEAAIEAYDTVVTRFGDSREPALREQVARALVNKSAALGTLERLEAVIEVYDSLLARFGDAEEPELREQVTWAMLIKGASLGMLGHLDAAIEAYDSVVARLGEGEEPALRGPVARALINKGVTLAEQGRLEPAIKAYDRVVARFGDAEEPELRESVSRALVFKGDILARLGQVEAAREAYETAVDLNPASPLTRNRLGNLYLDHIGDPKNALSTFESGLTGATENPDHCLLHSNCAYALALHGGDAEAARRHAEAALQDGVSISAAGRHLLQALPICDDTKKPGWQAPFDGIGKAVESGDSRLWSDYLDDLQRLIEYVIRQGEGASLKRWMEDRQYPMRQAPLYHALVAALEGEDHLLKINPETREPSQRIYEGIARLVGLYAPASPSAKPRRSKRA